MDRKAAIRKYKETATPMGVFCVRNVETGKAYVGTTPNLPAMLNRQRFQLANGVHVSRELQQDWNRLGAEGFAIEALDTLEPSKEPGYGPGGRPADARDDVAREAGRHGAVQIGGEHACGP